MQIINVNLNIGSTYLDEGKYDKAIQILYLALEDAKSTGFNHPIPVIYNNIAACHINLENFELANQNIEIAESDFGKFKGNLIDYFKELENFEAALEAAGAPYTPGRKFE